MHAQWEPVCVLTALRLKGIQLCSHYPAHGTLENLLAPDQHCSGSAIDCTADYLHLASPPTSDMTEQDFE